jgi:predicted phosphodiesterase
MNILVISDLHLDNGDHAGLFQWNELEFILDLERVRKQYSVDKVILNGDIFELFKYTLSDIEAANPVLTKYLSDSDIVFIRGNHDLISGIGGLNFQITNSSGQSIYIEHGHNADWFNGSSLGRRLGKLGLKFMKHVSHSRLMLRLYHRIIVLNEDINRVPKKYNTLKYLTYAMKLLKKYDVVILGHTHKLESHHTYFLNRKKRYLNCGSCSLGRFQGIVLDTETLKYEFIMERRESVKNAFSPLYVNLSE